MLGLRRHFLTFLSLGFPLIAFSSASKPMREVASLERGPASTDHQMAPVPDEPAQEIDGVDLVPPEAPSENLIALDPSPVVIRPSHKTSSKPKPLSCYQQFLNKRSAIVKGSLTRIFSSQGVQGCRKNNICHYKVILDAVAEKYSISKRLIYAVAWTETGWNHWKPSRDYPTVYVGNGTDFGMMQINSVHRATVTRAGFAKKLSSSAAWGAVKTDPLFNVLFAADQFLSGSGVCRFPNPRTVYSCYNAGPGGKSRWKTGRDNRDTNFNRYYNQQPWNQALRAAGC